MFFTTADALINLLIAKIVVEVAVINKLAVNNLRVDFFMKKHTSLYEIYNYYKSFRKKIQMFFGSKMFHVKHFDGFAYVFIGN